MTTERLEYLRQELRAERISYSELSELQSLASEIDPGDVELLEAAGVSETEDNKTDAPRPLGCPECKQADHLVHVENVITRTEVSYFGDYEVEFGNTESDFESAELWALECTNCGWSKPAASSSEFDGELVEVEVTK